MTTSRTAHNTPVSSLAQACAFGALAVGWLCVVGLLTALVALFVDPTFDSAHLPTWALSFSTIIQNGGWVLIAATLLRLNGLPQRDGFSLRPFSPALALIAALSGLSVGLFPGWLAAQLRDLIPLDWQLGSLDILSHALLNGALWERAAMLFAVVIAAPLCEELVFRGYLWSTLARALPTPAVWLITTLIFAAIHGDPVHVLAIAFTGGLLGWLRAVSGSVYLPMITHFVNNGLAACATFYAGGATPQDPPLLVGLFGLIFTFVLATFAWRLSPPEPT